MSQEFKTKEVKMILSITNHQRNQVKATMRYHLTPVRMDILKRQEIAMLTRMWKKWSPCVLWKYNWCSYCRKSMETSQKTKNRATIWYSNSTSGNLSKENGKKKNTNSERHMHPKFIAALVTIAKTWKQPKCPLMDKWIKKMWYIYVYTHTHIHIHTMEYYLAIKKNGILPFVTKWWTLRTLC